MALHGQKTTLSQRPENSDGSFVFNVWPSFRTTSYVFENPTVISGAQGNGPGLAPPRVFSNLRPLSYLSAPADTAAGRGAMDELVAGTAMNYVIPIATAPGTSLTEVIEPKVGTRGHSYLAQGRPVLGAGEFKVVYDPDWDKGGMRVQWLTDKSGNHQPFGAHTQSITEEAFQKNLDGDLRWFPMYDKPVTTTPFAGLAVQRMQSKTSTSQPEQELGFYEIRIPDSRALSTQGPPQDLEQKRKQFPDLASAVLEPLAGRPGWVRIRDIRIAKDMRGFLPPFIGQVLAAVQLEQPFKGLVVNTAFKGPRPAGGGDISWRWRDDFSNALTIYGLDKQLSEFSPEVPFVLERDLNSGDVEFFINPAVQTQR